MPKIPEDDDDLWKWEPGDDEFLEYMKKKHDNDPDIFFWDLGDTEDISEAIEMMMQVREIRDLPTYEGDCPDGKSSS